MPRSQNREDEDSFGSRINIQQKLQEKKEKQLAELRLIEEEIKQGKLTGPVTLFTDLNDKRSSNSSEQQPIPLNKKRDMLTMKKHATEWKKQACYNTELYDGSNCKPRQESASDQPAGNVAIATNVQCSRTKMPRGNLVFYKNVANANEQIQLPTNDLQYYAKSIMQKKFLRLKTQTPEILLTPHIVTNSCIYALNSYGGNQKTYSSDESANENNDSQISDIDSQVEIVFATSSECIVKCFYFFIFDRFQGHIHYQENLNLTEK